MAKDITIAVRVEQADAASIDAAVERARVRLAGEGVAVSRGSYLLGLHRVQEAREFDRRFVQEAAVATAPDEHANPDVCRSIKARAPKAKRSGSKGGG